MTPTPDICYLSRRAEQEAIMAIAATSPVAAAAHDAIRNRYCAVVNQAMRARPLPARV
mgnify:CR=1 FL=1